MWNSSLAWLYLTDSQMFSSIKTLHNSFYVHHWSRENYYQQECLNVAKNCLEIRQMAQKQAHTKKVVYIIKS